MYVKLFLTCYISHKQAISEGMQVQSISKLSPLLSFVKVPSKPHQPLPNGGSLNSRRGSLRLAAVNLNTCRWLPSAFRLESTQKQAPLSNVMTFCSRPPSALMTCTALLMQHLKRFSTAEDLPVQHLIHLVCFNPKPPSVFQDKERFLHVHFIS